MILVTCASKLTLSIFFVGAFVFAQFWAIASIISWSVKKLIFLMKIVKMGDFVSVISPWKRSPRLKFGGPKRTSQTGQGDGWGKKQKQSFLRGQFCCTKIPIFRLFENFQNWRFWSPNFSVITVPTEKTEYSTTKPTENARKLSSQIFDFQTLMDF